jgi:putative methionine-R-sulfoxide reductase with GAF domain
MADHVKKEVFVEGGSFYDNVKAQVEAVVEGEPDFIANTANISAILFEQLNKKKNNSINWAGFYFWKKDQLVLGPFQGIFESSTHPLRLKVYQEDTD